MLQVLWEINFPHLFKLVFDWSEFVKENQILYAILSIWILERSGNKKINAEEIYFVF